MESEAGDECAATVQERVLAYIAIVLTVNGGMDPLPLVAALNIPRLNRDSPPRMKMAACLGHAGNGGAVTVRERAGSATLKPQCP